MQDLLLAVLRVEVALKQVVQVFVWNWLEYKRC